MFQIPTGDNTSDGERTTPQGSTLGMGGCELPSFMKGPRSSEPPTPERAREQAAQIAGGEDQLNDLLSSSKSLLTNDEIDHLNRRLGDPTQAADAVLDLLHRKQRAGESESGPQTLREFNELARKARAGDANAKRVIASANAGRFQ